MTNLTRRLIGTGLAIVVLALPLAVGAENDTHRIVFSEDNTARTYNVATYGMVELTTIEEIANGEILDYETIRFLEDNIWVLDSSAGFADIDDIADGEVFDLETIRFLEDNIWDYQAVAEFGGVNSGVGSFLGEGLPKTDEETTQPQVARLPWLGTASEIYGQDDRTDIAEYGGINPEVDPFVGEGLPKTNEPAGPARVAQLPWLGTASDYFGHEQVAEFAGLDGHDSYVGEGLPKTLETTGDSTVKHTRSGGRLIE